MSLGYPGMQLMARANLTLEVAYAIGQERWEVTKMRPPGLEPSWVHR